MFNLNQTIALQSKQELTNLYQLFELVESDNLRPRSEDHCGAYDNHKSIEVKNPMGQIVV